MRRGIDRRTFLAAAAAGCMTVPFGRELVPYVDSPPEWAPGVPTFYATALLDHGLATGLRVECHDGRPTKVEGNPLHPASLGATSARHQAAILDLYDRSRRQALSHNGVPRDPADLRRALSELPPGGEGVHLLLEPTSSAGLARALQKVQQRLPAVRVHTAALDRREAEGGVLLAVGAPGVRQIDLAAAEIVFALDADPTEGPHGVRRARDLADARRRMPGHRVWVAEAGLTPFGATADERLGLRPSEVPSALMALAGELIGTDGLPQWPVREEIRRFVRRAADDLRHRPGVLLLGPTWPAWMHALVLAIDQATGALGRTVWITPSPYEDFGPDGLPELLQALDAGAVHTLMVLGDFRPAPAELELPRRMRAVNQIIGLGLHDTALPEDWAVPALHPFEAWGDARGLDGTRTPIQPLIRPLVPGWTPEMLLAALAGQPLDPRAHALAALGASDEEQARRFLAAGLVEGSALPRSTPPVDLRAVTGAIPAPPPPISDLEIGFSPCRRRTEGGLNLWLLEMPDPLTQLAWGNAAVLGPQTARAHGIETGSQIRLTTAAGAVELPAVVLPLQPEGLVSVETGYGQDDIGVDVDALRSVASPWRDRLVGLERLGEGRLVQAQRTLDREGRDVARVYDRRALQDLRQPPEPLSLWPVNREHGPQWGMAIDLDACTGCNACAVACQAENNVPVVGPIDLAKGRRMHWLRIDRYFDEQGATFQPMLCQHCEAAPCEYVCPVNATVHSDDGLNEQVYNRCVGTRFCSQNCPYKVRRFNWFDYSGRRDDWQVLQLNPDVTVRERGVMEKCTFCVQRIREGQRTARMAGREVADEDVVPACAAACPSQAITFGRVDGDGPVAALQRDPRAYGELDETLGTRPRVRYLARLRNGKEEP